MNNGIRWGAGILAAALGLGAPAAAEIVDHWEQGSAAVAGGAAAAFFDALDAEVRWNNGGFRQPSRVKSADFGRLRVFCDTYPAPVCLVGWTPTYPPAARVEVTTAELGGRAPCRGEFSISENGVAVSCGARGLAVSRAVPAAAAPAPSEGLSVHWCQDRSIDGIEICLTRTAWRSRNEFPLETLRLRLPGSAPVVVQIGPGEPGPSQKTGNRILDGGAGDAAWMQSFGYGDDGKLYSVLVSWSYFILSDNPDMRNVYVKSIRDEDAGREYLSTEGRPRAIRMKPINPGW